MVAQLRSRTIQTSVTKTRTPQQTASDRVAAGIRKQWSIGRVNKRSRGIDARYNHHCYLVTGLQCLLHLPKFVNWIRLHNVTQADNTTSFPCTGNGYRGRFRGQRTQYRHWVACAMKDLIGAYWGGGNLDAHGVPQHLNSNAPGMRTLTDWANHNIGNDRQADPQEMLVLLLDDLHQSSPHTATENCIGVPFTGLPRWTQMFYSLFLVLWESHEICNDCNHSVATTPLELHPGTDTLAFDDEPTHTLKATLDEALRTEMQGRTCQSCASTNITRVKKILFAPEYLIVHLNLNRWGLDDNHNYVPTKIFDEMRIPLNLNMTHHQTDDSTLLWFTLASVAQHVDTTVTSGHWQATAKGPEKAYVINGRAV